MAAQLESVADDAAGPQRPRNGRPRRIVLVAPFGLRPKGTTSARVLPIARVLAAQGARVRVVIPPWDDPGRAGQRWQVDSVEVVHTSAGGGPLGSAHILGQLLRETREFAPDVVHCFKPIGYSGALASILTASARRRGMPLVVVDADDLEGPGGWSGRRRLGIAGAVRGAQESATLRNAPLATVASEWLRQHLLRLGRPADSILHLPNGHSIAPRPAGRRSRAKPSESPEVARPVLLWYTRFTEVRPARAAELIARSLAAVPSARLVIVGEEINAGDRAATAAALAAVGIGDRVDWRGYEPDAVEGWLSGSHDRVVAIYPMDDDPTNRARCPSKIPQLMALGIPLVAESVGEIPLYLAGAEAECLVAAGGQNGFVEHVSKLLEDAGLHAKVQRRLKAGAARWHWDAVAGGLLDWYTRQLAIR